MLIELFKPKWLKLEIKVFWFESEIDTRPELLMQIKMPISLIFHFFGDPAARFTFSQPSVHLVKYNTCY